MTDPLGVRCSAWTLCFVLLSSPFSLPGTVAVLTPRWILAPGARWRADIFGTFGLIRAAAGAARSIFGAHGGPSPVTLDAVAARCTQASGRAYGLYRVMRNPMYVGVGTFVASEAIPILFGKSGDSFIALERVGISVGAVLQKSLLCERNLAPTTKSIAVACLAGFQD